jgi:hypothetical protein
MKALLPGKALVAQAREWPWSDEQRLPRLTKMLLE